MGYYKDTVRGLGWMGGLRISVRALGFVRIAILARLLTPNQFGLFGIAMLTLSFLEILTESGINVFFIQGEGKIKEYVDTAWIVSIIRGLLITLLIVIFAKPITVFFKNPDAYSLLLLVSVVSFFRGFINPAIIRLRKDLEFNKEFRLRFVVLIVETTVAIALAFVTRSASSLVWGLIAGVLVEAILSFTMIKPRPKLGYESHKVSKIIKRGKWVTLAGIFSYLFKEGDDIIVGRLMGTDALGIYQVGYKISTLPITEVSGVVRKVTFPVYSRIVGDKLRLKKAFVKSITAVSLVAIPFGLFLYLFAQPFVMIVLGSKWLEAVPVIKVLALFGVVRAITTMTYPLFLSVKKQEYVMIITLVGILGLGFTVYPLVMRYGLVGAGYSALFGAILTVQMKFYYVKKVFR